MKKIVGVVLAIAVLITVTVVAVVAFGKSPDDKAEPIDGTNYSEISQDENAIKEGFSGLKEATPDDIEESKTQWDKDAASKKLEDSANSVLSEIVDDYSGPAITSDNFDKFPKIRDKIIAVSLQLDGEIICRQTDMDTVNQIADMFQIAKALSYEPKTYNINGDFIIAFETSDGGACCLQLDLLEDLFLADTGFYDYGEADTDAVKELWNLFEIDRWPEEVYTKYADFFAQYTNTQ